jgi:hypothetical protein
MELISSIILIRLSTTSCTPSWHCLKATAGTYSVELIISDSIVVIAPFERRDDPITARLRYVEHDQGLYSMIRSVMYMEPRSQRERRGLGVLKDTILKLA